MNEILNWFRPILCGLAGGFFVWLLIRMTKEKSERDGNLRILTYGKSFKFFSALSVLFTSFVVYAVSQSYKGQELAAFLVATGFIACSFFLSYQAFFIKFSYDEQFIYYKSPFVGSKKAPWENLVDVGHSSLIQSDYITVEGIGKIWCSSMLNGYIEFVEFLEMKIEELSPE